MPYNQISLPQWQNLIRRVFGLGGQGGNVPVVSPEIQPVVILQPDNPEFARLRLEKMWSGGTQNASGVGTAGVVAFVNPEGSGRIAVFTLVTAWLFQATQNSAAIRLDTQANVEALAANVVSAPAHCSTRDTREIFPGSGTPGLVIRNGPSAGPFPGFPLARKLIAQSPATVANYADLTVHNVVLTPGFGMYAHTGALGAGQNVDFVCEWFEREFAAEESKA